MNLLQLACIWVSETEFLIEYKFVSLGSLISKFWLTDYNQQWIFFFYCFNGKNSVCNFRNSVPVKNVNFRDISQSIFCNNFKCTYSKNIWTFRSCCHITALCVAVNSNYSQNGIKFHALSSCLLVKVTLIKKQRYQKLHNSAFISLN